MRLIQIKFLVVIIFLLLVCSCNNRSIPKGDTVFGQVALIENKEYSITDLQIGYKDGSLSVESVVQFYLQRIENIDDSGPLLNAVITTNSNALKMARQLDQDLLKGLYRGPMHGVPVLLKDNIDTYDLPTTGGSRALRNSYPLDDAYITKKLREAGAIILGKANLSEWANFRGENSSSGWSGVGGQTKNPYILDRNPCGSSSGSAVAVAANLCVIAIGTETNGSIVCPSQANGVVGIKPTVGLISRNGIIPISWNQDTAGPIARSIKDVAICLGALAGVDPLDDRTVLSDGNFYDNYIQFIRAKDLKRMRIGYYTGADEKNSDVDVLTNRAVSKMKDLGAEIIEVDQIFLNDEINYNAFQVMLHEYKDGLNDYFASLGPDAAIKNLTELIEFNMNDKVEMDFYGQEYLEMAAVMEGMESEDYFKHLEAANLGSRVNGIDRVMDAFNLDAIMAPSGSPAWKTDHANGDKFTLGSSSPAAISGYPSITVPMGYVDELPVGLSIFGRQWSEGELIDIAYLYEQATKHRRAPKYIEK
ncbi:amidase [Saprospiraceae bacterium]|nr:amidase [Saprospiraceae bacterium]